jgi:hypothetical protein
VAILVIACVAVTGCATEVRPDQASPNAISTKKDISAWALPLNPYLPPAWDPVSYAENILTKRCMDGTQYTWDLAAETLDPPIGESWNSVHRKLFTPALAARYGYSNSDVVIVSEAERAARRRAFETPFDPAGRADLDRCTAAARKELKTTKSPYDLAQRVQFTDESRSDKRRVDAAAKRWKTCMQPLGIPNVPNSPKDMSPSVFLSRAERGPLDSPEPPVIGAREKEVATHDATCQQTSGYAQASYDAEWNAELRALNENADALERDRHEAVAQRKRAMKIIAEYAPAA